MFITDATNYPSLPCNYCTFSPGTSLTDLDCTSTCGGETVATNFTHPKTATLSFVPSERWGSFSIPEGIGFTGSNIFSTQLDPTQGLSVEVYGDNEVEEYRLAYMIVEVIGEE